MIGFLTRALAALAALFLIAGGASAQTRLPVVATFSILADFVREVGGDRVAVTSLVGPNADAHAYAPTPDDARRIAAARLVLVNGLGFEGWLSRLADAAARGAPTVVASRGVRVRAREDDPKRPDPHAWHDVANAKRYVTNIRDALAAADPAAAAVYAENAAAYLAQLDALDAEVREAIGRIPPARRRVITSHDAFGYFGAAYGLAFVAPEGVAADAEASARDVARIIAQIRRERIPAVFLENIKDPRLMQRIAHESGARIGGTLYSDALSGPDGPAPTYIAMMRSNLRALAAALAE